MSLQRPLFSENPRFRTPEQAALLALFDRIEELEQISRVEVRLHIETEQELMNRITTLEARVARLEGGK